MANRTTFDIVLLCYFAIVAETLRSTDINCSMHIQNSCVMNAGYSSLILKDPSILLKTIFAKYFILDV